MHSRITFRILLLAVLFLAAATAPAGAQDAPRPVDSTKPEDWTAAQKANVRVLDGMLAAIRGRFYDREFSGLKLETLRDKYLPRVLASAPNQPLHAVLSELLAEFKVSHLALVEADVYAVHFAPEFSNSYSTRPGFELTKAGEHYFVGAVNHGGGADKAGLLRGDRIVTVNGVAIEKSDLLVDGGTDVGIPGRQHLVVRVPLEKDKTLTLEVQRKRGDEKLRTIKVTPTAFNLIQATAESVAVIERGGRKLGYIRIWHVLHEEISQILSRAIRRTWEDCDGLIIDLRGRGGSPDVMNACFEPFGAPPPQRDRRGNWRPLRYGMPKWIKPVVALTDTGSRSAKEVYAHNWKYLDVGPVVGETTAGAVLGSTFVPMPDGSHLLLPVASVPHMTYGNVQLEGNGVVPTHPMKDHLEYAEGGDIIKEAGIKVLLGEINEAAKAGSKSGKPPVVTPEPGKEPEEQFSR